MIDIKHLSPTTFRNEKRNKSDSDLFHNRLKKVFARLLPRKLSIIFNKTIVRVLNLSKNVVHLSKSPCPTRITDEHPTSSSHTRTNDGSRNIDNTKLRQTTGTQTWPDLNLGVTIETQTDTTLNNVTNVTKKVKAKVLKRPKSPPQEMVSVHKTGNSVDSRVRTPERHDFKVN